MALSFQSSILRSLLHSHQEPPPQPMFVPTPDTAVTSSTSSPRACCGTWWQPGHHLDHHILSHNHLKPNTVTDINRVTSSEGRGSLSSAINNSGSTLTQTVDFNQYQHHLVPDDNGISSTTHLI